MSKEQRVNIATWAGIAISVALGLMSYGALAQRVDRLEADRREDSQLLRRIDRRVERMCALRPGCE